MNPNVNVQDWLVALTATRDTEAADDPARPQCVCCPTTPKPEPLTSASPARPAHYAFDRIECREAIREMLGDDGYQAFLRGNITKYVWRLGRKASPKADAMKARLYLDWLIAMMPEDA